MRVFSHVKVGIMIEDKRLEYRVMEEFKRRNIPFVLLNSYSGDVDVVVSDAPRNFNAIVANDAKIIARRVISYLYGRKRFHKMIVGIDPGPKPGIAVVGDGLIVEEMQLSNMDIIKDAVDEIYKGYKPEKFLIKIGNGDVVNRNRIVNLLVDYYTVEIVDERNTSNSITNRDVESAKNIAFSNGNVVRKKLNTVLRDGHIREIQRRSRIESKGMITISRDLARKVLLGEITMEEAINMAREHDEEE